jgi:hypothetical protein
MNTVGPVPALILALFMCKTTDAKLVLIFKDGLSGAPFDDDDDHGGPTLNNVRVESLPPVPLPPVPLPPVPLPPVPLPPVPLPAAASMLLAGLGALAMLRRRCKA